MNEERWGMCDAYGCPLPGSMGSEGRWYCFCHVNKSSGDNDRITRAIQDLDFIAQSTLEIRGGRQSKEWPAIYRGIQQRFIRAGREDLLLGKQDCSPHKPGVPIVNVWLMRLERELLEATTGGNKKIPATVQTAPVVGPAHAITHFSEYDSCN